MKKKSVLSLFGGVAVAAMAIATCVLNTTGSSTSNKVGASLGNVAAAQASATEFTCDKSNTNLCNYNVGGVVINSSGKAIVND
jgi:hypothetical protein